MWFSSITAASFWKLHLDYPSLSKPIGYHVYKLLLAKAAFICMTITKAQLFGLTCNLQGAADFLTEQNLKGASLANAANAAYCTISSGSIV